MRTLLVFVFLVIYFDECTANEKKVIVTGNRMVKSLVECIVKDRYFVYCPVSANICPGHYSYKISDVINAEKSIAIFYNGYEIWIKELIRKRNLNNKKRKIVIINDELMIPENYERNARMVCDVLSEIDKRNSNFFEKNYDELSCKIKGIIQKMRKFSKVKVACSLYQKAFARWLGLKVVCVFSMKNARNPSDATFLIKRCRRENVVLVIENLQSKFYIGRVLANELNVPYVCLSNFPLKNETYFDLLNENYKKIKDAINSIYKRK